MPADWPKEVWLNRFDDLPLEWWANPSTTSDPEDIAGKPLEARHYVPESSDLVSLSGIADLLEEWAAEADDTWAFYYRATATELRRHATSTDEEDAR